jgi:two-component system, LuxR family, sensor kinase FixL
MPEVWSHPADRGIPSHPRISVVSQLDLLEQAVAAERRQIARELHDGLSQELTGLSFLARTLTLDLQGSDSSLRDRSERLSSGISQVIRQLREVIEGMDSPVAEAGSLVRALKRLAGVTQERFNIDCQFECSDCQIACSHTCEQHLYRIAQEAVSNAVRHGQARTIRISLTHNPEALALVIEDNGVGFAVESIAQAGARSSGFGLRNMRERAIILGASLSFERAETGGTRVRCLQPSTGIRR